MSRQWVALSTRYHVDPDTLSLPVAFRYAWVILLGEAKRNGWQDGIPKVLVYPFIENYAGVKTRQKPLFIAALLARGWIIDAGSTWAIPGWNKYQRDPTNADRQQRKRNADKRDKSVTSNAGTGTSTLTGTEPPPPPSQGGDDADASPDNNGRLTTRQRERFARQNDFMIACGPLMTHKARAYDVRALLATGSMTDSDIRAQSVEWDKWATRDKLANFEKRAK